MWIHTKGDATLITCRVHPGAPRDAIEGVRDDHLMVRLTSPPVEGKANKALVKLMSKLLHVPQGRISILQGEKSRIKVLAVTGTDPQTIRKQLAGYPGVET